MDLKLRGKRALVTGSTAGIGFAIAQGLARERAEVIVNGRTEQKVAEAVQRISSEVGSRTIGIAADLSSAEGVARLGAQAGRVDILVNNVGIFWPVPFLEISDQDWFHIFEVNVMSGAACAVPRHRREHRGHRSHGEFGPAGTDQVGRRSRLPWQGRRRTQD
jgi:NAD(P)-dependent dehydrogenase (short-subunit alcohol dehydrogenase family)